MVPPTHLAAVRQNAHALRRRGDLAGARSLLEHALQLAGTPYDPDVLETARLLAALQREGGDLSAARRTLEETIAAAALRRPESDPLMVLLAYDLGEVADEFGNRHEARRNMSAVARLGPAALGADHPAVQQAERYLAGPDPTRTAPAPPAPPAATPPAPPAAPPAAAAPPRTIDTSTRITTGATARVPAHSRSRGPGTEWIVALVVIGLAAAAGAALLLRGRDEPVTRRTTSATASASPARPAPTGVRLRDDGSSITLTWRDPAAGAVPFIVAGGRAGEQSRPFAQLPAGRTGYTVNGLNPRLEYCFTIVAVYSTEMFAPSPLVCTRRAGNPQPTRS